LCGEREPDGLKLVVRDRQWVVEEHHYAVSREVLECPLVVGDQRAQHAVVLPQQSEHLLWRGGLGETGEAPQIAEQARDVGTVPCE
jgi:hypothetical protein